MPRNLVELAVLISCPSDLNEERQIVKAAVEEVGESLKKTRSVALYAISWESDLLPGVGADPQSVINSQLDGRYDIYIGLLGTRFGAETPRASSGTEEEFNRALETYRAAPSKMRVLFYFKNSSENLHGVDLEQFRKVIEFRKKISETTLYSEFSTSEALLKMLKQHLQNLVIDQWEGDKWKVLTPIFESAISDSGPNVVSLQKVAAIMTAPQLTEDDYAADEDQERGTAILDVMLSAEDGSKASLAALDNMTVLAAELTDSLNARTAAVPSSPSVRELKTTADCVADDLDKYAAGLKQQILVFKSNLSSSLNDFDTAVDLYFSEKIGEASAIAAVPENMATLASGLRQGKVSLDQFRAIMASVPGLTVRFKKSRRLVMRLLDDLSAAIVVFSDKAQSIALKFPK